MTKYTLYTLAEHTESLIDALQQMGVMDIRRSNKSIDAHSAALLQKAEAIKEMMAGTEWKAAQAQKRALMVALEKELAAAKLWGACDSTALNELAAEGYTLEFHIVASKSYNSGWENEYPICVIGQDKGKTLFIVVCAPGEEASGLPGAISRPRSQIAIQVELDSTTAEMASIGAKIASLPEMLPQLKTKYDAVMSQLDAYLAGKASVLSSDESENALAGYLNVFEGYAPAELQSEICGKLDGMSLYYTAEEATEDDTPIKLRNNRFTSLFECLTGMYGMPVYGEWDPTPILAPFFLLFFAICMGDAGYGLILILYGILQQKKIVNISMFSGIGKLITVLGCATAVVGFFLGTAFGCDLTTVQWIPQCLRDCMLTGNIEIAGSSYALQMVLALCIGVFHICLAMTVKALLYTQRFGFKANISTWGWLILILGSIITGIVGAAGILSADATKYVIIGIGVVSALAIFIFNKPGRNPLLNIGAGLWDTYNMATGILGDVLSYIRLYALGLAGGMLGGAFNNLGFMVLGDNPTWQWIPFVLILLAGHVLNLLMSCLGAFVHPLRLSFVEYFKNSGYEGKGRAYNALKK